MVRSGLAVDEEERPPFRPESNNRRSGDVRLFRSQGRERVGFRQTRFKNARLDFFLTIDRGALPGAALGPSVWLQSVPGERMRDPGLIQQLVKRDLLTFPRTSGRSPGERQHQAWRRGLS